MSFGYPVVTHPQGTVSVFHPHSVRYKPDGSGRDTHCFSAQREYFDVELPKLNTSVNHSYRVTDEKQ